MRPEQPVTIRLSEYQPLPYAAETIDLEFDLAPSATTVRAKTRFRRVSETLQPLVLNGARFKLERIALNGAALTPDAYRVEPEHLIIFHPPEHFTLEVDTLLDPAANTALEGLYVSGGRFCTQCEAEGFRTITYALDRPDSLSRFTVRIEADKAAYPTMLSNGDPMERGDLPGGRHFAVWRDPHPKPTYLFALVAGSYDSLSDNFVTRSGRKVALGIHVDHGDAPRAAYAMDALKRSMKWDEDVFQREYDLDVFNIVAVRDFNFGAMENKGLNVFNSAYVLADPDTATDADYEAIESIVAHEYFHNWTGNRITLRDWFQLCLKEGLTVFRDQEFSADARSRAVQRIKDVKQLRARQFAEDAGPLAHPVRPNAYQKIDNFYTATVYEKGAEVIRMLKTLIGDAAFAKGMQLYFQRCDGTSATVEAFIDCFAEASGRDLSDFMLWYSQAGTPSVTVRTEYDAASGRAVLHLQQNLKPTPNQPAKRAMPIPLRIGFIDAEGRPLIAKREGGAAVATEHLVAFETSTGAITFTGLAARPIPALLRDFSAPVNLVDNLSTEDRLAQMAHDPDPFTRWEAGQTIARAAVADVRRGANAPLSALAEALGRELARADGDPDFAALALRLPDLAELIQTSDDPNPDELHAALERVRESLAVTLKPQLLDIARRPSAPFSPDARSAGARALKAAALDLLAALGSETTHVLTGAFADARSMTEQVAALNALGANGASAFDGALDIFFQRWRANPLVVDKWFALQAAAPRADSLARVNTLRAHTEFDLRTPNRVRALVMNFALRNPRAFHAADGGGYRFLASIAAEVDAINPAVAARILGPFESWRRFDTGRQAQAKAALEGLAGKASLSKNAREIVERTLA